ncbi:hypothetical protein [Nocardia sp. NPDC057353]|uniref:hypothetical protein n=1 Tax=Nocardia sp. NPDC057353 TaxID=3346104 RepID=UPI00363D394A
MFATTTPRKALVRLAAAAALAAAPVIALAAPAAATPTHAPGPVATEIRYDPFNPFQRQCNWWDRNAPWWERCDAPWNNTPWNNNPWNNNPWNNPWQQPFTRNVAPGTFGSS